MASVAVVIILISPELVVQALDAYWPAKLIGQNP
jgi:hypothetical protein